MANQTSPFWRMWQDDLVAFGDRAYAAGEVPNWLVWSREHGGPTVDACRFKYRHRKNDLLTQSEPAPQPDDPNRKMIDTGVIHGGQIRTLDQLIQAAEVDLDEWEIERHIINKWDVGQKGPDGKPAVVPLWQVKVWLKRPLAAKLLAEIGSQVVADIRSASKRLRVKTPASLKARGKTDDHLLEYAPMDIHYGKYAWAEETGDDYDLDVASDRYRYSTDWVISHHKSYGINQILYVVGNDFFHVDNLEQSTTAGTRQDVDSRYAKVFRRGLADAIWSVRRLLEVAPVRVLVIPGNHDMLATFHLGEVLSAVFGEQDHVDVDNRPTTRKYYRYGATLLGFTHGAAEKLESLPGLMAHEAKAEWAQARHYEWHVGHWHHRKTVQFLTGDTRDGVTVRFLPALCAPDAWHVMKGFNTAEQACEAYLWHREGCYVGHTSVPFPAVVAGS